MTMTLGVRKLVLTAHVVTSAGWLGAVAAFLALAIAGLTTPDAQMARGAYFAMNLTAWFVILPLCGASLLTGLVSSMGTTWGLFRHYWIVAKLLITVPASALLIVHLQPIGYMARAAAERSLSRGDLEGLRAQLAFEAAAALLALITATTLSVYKPLGRVPEGPLEQLTQLQP